MSTAVGMVGGLVVVWYKQTSVIKRGMTGGLQCCGYLYTMLVSWSYEEFLPVSVQLAELPLEVVRIAEQYCLFAVVSTVGSRCRTVE